MPLQTDAEFLPQLERFRKAGVSLVSLNVGFAERDWVEHMRVLSFMRRWVALQADDYQLVANVEDVYRCKEQGKLGIVFDIEGMYPVQQEPGLVQTFYELGVRWMLVAYNRNNAAGGGCLDTDNGLTEIGRRIIDEMERVGMVLCLSHTGARTAAEALGYARNPVILSHSNPFGDTPHVRNVSDELMIACARKGGVIGLSGISTFVGGHSNLVSHLMRQLHYVIDRVGADHVGLALDYVFDRRSLDSNVRANPTLYPEGITGSLQMVEPEEWQVIADNLAASQLSDDQIRGVLGGNWLRIAKAVWR